MKPNDIAEWCIEIPYRLPERTIAQRLLRIVLFVPLLLVSFCLIVLSGFITIPWKLAIYIKKGPQ